MKIKDFIDNIIEKGNSIGSNRVREPEYWKKKLGGFRIAPWILMFIFLLALPFLMCCAKIFTHVFSFTQK